uniref:NADH-ubiquinone oxidoreductase chain 2 n=1 Tax=Polydora hoplura TaxID=1495204 RepID=A0A8F9S3A0_9ANNE|nr:NADH dehydrogenase subunit 2 [Polydora hoplura]QYL01505.1 NADH dehydrogenase subunit 2 [Polydora hoplura]
MLLIQWLFCWSLFLSTFVAISASIPLYTWAALEVNTIAFIPMMLDPSKPESVRAAMKYFFIQAYASLIFLVGPLLNSLPEMTIFLAMMMKLGMSPFHNWYPSVMASLNWMSAFFISTWQKIAPLWILSENIFNSHLVAPIAALNAMIGGLGGLMQTEIRPLLAFSSIGHMGWLLFSAPLSNFILFLYFISYSLHLMILMYLFYSSKINTPKDMSSSNSLSTQTKLVIALSLLSLGGLPPLLGFIPKLLVLMISAPLFIFPLLLMIGSYINIYYYMSIMWVTFMTSPQPIKSVNSSNITLYLATFITSILFLTLICGLNMHL